MTCLALARPNHSYDFSSFAFINPARVYAQTSALVAGRDLSIEMDELIKQWHAETFLMSSVEDMTRVESYRKILEFGHAGLQYVIGDIEKNPSMLMLVAEEICGESPITDAIRGDVRAMSGAWVGWYQKAKHERS